MEPEGSLPHSQVPVNCLYTEPARPNHVYDKGSVQFRGTSLRFVTCYLFWGGGVVSISPNPWAVGPHLVSCPQLFIQYIRSYSPYSRPFLHPQPEDAPYRGDRDPHITDIYQFHT
jgi:hypothetical protein